MGKSETEQRILKAAREEFLSKGYDGTRMRSIADRAEINKGLLHYYFKTKDTLLIEVFHETFEELFISLGPALSSKDDLFTKIRSFVSVYTDFMIRHPELPGFIIGEMKRDPQAHIARMKKAGAAPPLQGFAQQVLEARKQGIIRAEIEPSGLILNMICMILFPVVAKPMVQFMHDLNDTQHKQLLQKRKEEISEFIIHAIQA